MRKSIEREREGGHAWQLARKDRWSLKWKRKEPSRRENLESYLKFQDSIWSSDLVFNDASQICHLTFNWLVDLYIYISLILHFDGAKALFNMLEINLFIAKLAFTGGECDFAEIKKFHHLIVILKLIKLNSKNFFD